MAKNLLTDRKVMNAKPQDKEYLLNDGDGLYLRVRHTGAKSWLAKTKSQKKTLGSYPAMSLQSARLEFANWLSYKPSKGPETMTELFDVWVESYAKLNRKEVKSQVNIYNRHVRPYIGNEKLHNLTRGKVVAVVDRVVQAGSPSQAGIVFSLIKQCLTYAYTREYMTNLPLYGVKSKDLGVVRSERDRVITSKELVELKDALTAWLVRKPSSSVFSIGIWLALSTGARSVEVVTMRAEDVSLDSGLWTIPEEVVKTEVAHVVHLNAISRKLLEGVEERQGYLFNPTRQEKKRKTAPHIQPHALLEHINYLRYKGKLRENDYTVHDMRRTAATIMGELGVDENVIELCLNHKEEKKVKRTYQRQQRLDDRRRAFEALGDYLVKVLDGVDWLPTVASLPRPKENASPLA